MIKTYECPSNILIVKIKVLELILRLGYEKTINQYYEYAQLKGKKKNRSLKNNEDHKSQNYSSYSTEPSKIMCVLVLINLYFLLSSPLF